VSTRRSIFGFRGDGRSLRAGSFSHASTSLNRQRGIVGPSHIGAGNVPALIFRCSVHWLTFNRLQSGFFSINSIEDDALLTPVCFIDLSLPTRAGCKQP
jgi:hypothetical protein